MIRFVAKRFRTNRMLHDCCYRYYEHCHLNDVTSSMTPSNHRRYRSSNSSGSGSGSSSGSSSGGTLNRKIAKSIWLRSVYDNDLQSDAPNSSMSSTTSTPPTATTTTHHWREWYTHQEYQNPWDITHMTHPDAFPSQYRSPSATVTMETIAKNLDYMSKHCLSLLQNYHNFTVTTQNSITTEFCNVILHKLLQLFPTNTTTSSSAFTSAMSTEKATVIAIRAYHIVQNMEFTDGTILPMPSGTMPANQSTIIRRRSPQLQYYTDAKPDETDHHPSTASLNLRTQRLPRTIPKPNRDTYNTILLLLSRTSGSYTIPQMARAIVDQMEYRYNVQQELDVKVTNYHYNCILLSWSLCVNYDKCLYAAQALIYNATRNHSHEIVDASSYIHVLRICAHHVKLNPPPNVTTTTTTNSIFPSTQRQQQENLRLHLLGANVAVQLWMEMFERKTTDPLVSFGALDSQEDTSMKTILTQHLSDEERHTPLYVPDLPPHFYSHFLQAIRQLPVVSYNSDPRSKGKSNHNNSSDYSIRDLYFMKCMDHAVANGKVNAFVLQEFFVHVKNNSIFDKYLGDYRSEIYGMTPNDAVPHLLKSCVPPSWYRNIQPSTPQSNNRVKPTE